MGQRSQNLLVALGWRVLRFEWNDIVNRPAVVAAQILAALRERQTAFDLGYTLENSLRWAGLILRGLEPAVDGRVLAALG